MFLEWSPGCSSVFALKKLINFKGAGWTDFLHDFHEHNMCLLVGAAGFFSLRYSAIELPHGCMQNPK